MNDAEATVNVTLPDGSRRAVVRGSRAGDVLRAWAPDRADTFLAAALDGAPIDLDGPIRAEGTLNPLTFDDRAGRDILQHSSAHLVAKAVTEVIPGALPTAGPPSDEGFYYDFDMRPLVPEDLDRIREAMDRAIAADERFERFEAPREEAERLCASNPHKLGYVREVPSGEAVSFYRTGGFVDLCRGPHVPSTRWLRGAHILGYSAITVEAGEAGSRQRIRGIGFPTREALAEYLKLRKEAESRDHRLLGQKLELFHFVEEAPGFPIWLPNGMIVVRELERFVTEHLHEAGYAEIRTPLLFAQSVFETSGHWELFRENMFTTTIEDRTFGWKPMNCPGAMLVFRSRARSYRELPLRLAEFAPLHRYEASGTLHGLTRVREFVQDDAHLFVSDDQIEGEIRTLLDWVARAFSTLHLAWSYDLSTRPAKFLGEPADWDRAEATLKAVLESSGIPFKVSPGEGAFYGPKIDIHIRDSLGRPWQTGTIQLDYQIPRRFGLQYQGADGLLHTPVVIHRTILGTWERFFGVVLEHTNGRLPPWLAPVQVRVLPVAERHQAAADGLAKELRAARLRAEATGSQDSLSKRVRESEIERVPYVAVIGDTEVETGGVALRVRGTKGTVTLSRGEFIGRVGERVRSRAFDP